MDMFINYNPKMPVIVLGFRKNVDAMRENVSKCSGRVGQVIRMVTIFSDQDMGLEPAVERCTTWQVHGLIVRPAHSLHPLPGYVLLHGVPLIAELFQVLSTAAGVPTDLPAVNVVYVTMKARDATATATLIGAINGRSQKYTYHTGLMHAASERNKITQSLSEHANHALRQLGPQSERVMAAMWLGNPVTKDLFNPPPPPPEEDDPLNRQQPDTPKVTKNNEKEKGRKVKPKADKKQRTLTQMMEGEEKDPKRTKTDGSTTEDVPTKTIDISDDVPPPVPEAPSDPVP